MSDCDRPFDIRMYAPYGPTNDYVEAGYDMINRIMLLIGTVEIDSFFKQPWGDLMPQMLDKIDRYHQWGVIKNEPYVRSVINRLASYSTMTFDQYLSAEICPQSLVDITGLMVELWGYGVCFPFPPPSYAAKISAKVELTANQKARITSRHQALASLAQVAGGMTYRDFFPGGRPLPEEKTQLDTIRQAIHQAHTAGVFPLVDNGWCCDADDPPVKCILVGAGNVFCLPTGGSCVPGGGISDCGPLG